MGWRFVDGQLKLKQLNKGTVEIVNDGRPLSLSLSLSEVERRMALILLGGQYRECKLLNRNNLRRERSIYLLISLSPIRRRTLHPETLFHLTENDNFPFETHDRESATEYKEESTKYM